MKILLLFTIVSLLIDYSSATTYRSVCPALNNPENDCSGSVFTDECSDDKACEDLGQVCCHNGCTTVCTNPVYYKASCPEDDILSTPEEWTKFCMGDCNCPEDMACCPGPCTTQICRVSNIKRVDCPSPETYSCGTNDPLVIFCSDHKDCIDDDQLCCPDACNNRYCQDPEFHEGTESSPSIELKISPKIGKKEKTLQNESETCDPMGTCFDISLTLGGESMEKFFPLWTAFIHNTVKKCAGLCLLWGYSKAAISTEIGCFCYNDHLDKLNCKPEETCSHPCPGGGKGNCGGIMPFYINIYNTDIITSKDAKALFPSGMCYKPKVNKTGHPMADALPTLPALTPNSCKIECGHRGFAWSCTYTGNKCLCYLDGNQPAEIGPFQEYCIARCSGDLNGVPNGITCGSEPPPALALVNCLPTQ